MESQELSAMKREGRATWISGRLLLCALLLVFGTFGAAPLAHAAFTMPQNNLGLVGWWTMDRITGTTVVDSSGSGNNGAEVGGPVQVAGKIGQALSFNGTSQYVGFTSPFGGAPTSLTVSGWLQGTPTFKVAISLGNQSTNPWLGTDQGKWEFNTSGGQLVLSTGIATSGWHLVTGVWSGGTAFIYIDGKLNNSASTSIGNASGLSQIGGDSAYAGYNWPGSIDDVRIYNRALSAAEVQTLYQSSLPAHIASSINTPDLAKGLVGWWTFDGNDVSGTSVFDKSGSGNTGAMVNSPKLVAGQIGQALSFNGTSQYLNIPYSSSLSVGGTKEISVSAWAKLSSFPAVPCNNSAILANGPDNGSGASGDYGLLVGDTGGCGSATGVKVLEFYIDDSSGNQYAATVTVPGNIVLGRWYLLSATYDGTGIIVYLNGVAIGSAAVTATIGSNTNPITVGSNYGNPSSYRYYVNGSIDDVRIYNRALSASEVQSLYDLGKQSHIASTVNPSGLSAGLVGHWSFDGAHLTTTTAYDTSGQGNNGTLVNSPKPTAGVIGQALSFNGSNQYLSVSPYPSVYNAFSVSTWVYPTSLSQGSYGGGTGGALIDENQSGGGSGWDLSINSSGKVWYWPFGGGDKVSTGTVPLNRWTYVTVTYDGSLLRMYFNGVLDSAQSASAASGSGPFFRIGAESWITGYWKGKLDDMRVYNRALSVSEVKQLYMLGH